LPSSSGSIVSGDEIYGKWEEHIMQSDIFEGRWRQMRGELRSWWGKLTDDDLEKIAGKKDKLIGMLQEKYGYTRERAEQEVERRFKTHEESLRPSSPSGTGQTKSSSQDRTSGPEPAAEMAKREAERLSSAAAAQASHATTAVGEKIGSLADVIREKAPHEGAVGTAATAVAEKLDVAGSYLQKRSLEHIGGDLTALIRRHPVPSLLIGLGIGYLLGRTRGR
jgi:uncharacterized protein YjbJ (UPF0337 family)